MNTGDEGQKEHFNKRRKEEQMGGEDEGECQEEVVEELDERELDNEGGG